MRQKNPPTQPEPVVLLNYLIVSEFWLYALATHLHSPCILDELRHRSMRPSELHKALPEATPRVLDIQLKELVDDGLVIKTIYPELPPRSEYSISELGMSLIPIIDSMLAWGEQHMEVFKKKYKLADY